jgi:hypothetical protein
LLLVAALGALIGIPASAWAAPSKPCKRPVPGAEALSCAPVPAKPSSDWQQQIVHLNTPFVYPEAVEVEGAAAEVSEPDGLRGEGGGTTNLTTSSKQSSSIIIDLGRLTMGNVEVGVKSASGAPIRVSYSEFRQFVSPDGDEVCCSFGTDDDPESRVDLFEPPAGEKVLVSPGKRETRWVLLTLDGPGTISVDFIRTRQSIYPINYDGHLLTSDELLNRAWYNSAYTGDLSTVTQNGSPWMLLVTFDRVLFMGDLQMQAQAGYYESSDYRWLMRNTLEQFGCVQNPDGSLPLASSPLVTCKPGDPGPADGWRVPEEGPDPDEALGHAGKFSLYHDIPIDSFTAFWVVGLSDYYRYSGDSKFVRSMLPVARRAIGFLRSRTTPAGLYYEPHDSFVFRSNWHPGDTASGIDTFTNAAYFRALEGLATMERDVAGQVWAARAYEKEAAKVKTSLIASNWDPAAQAMVLNNEDPLKDHTGDANAGPLMFELFDKQHAAAAMKFLETKLSTPWGTRSSEYEDNPYMQSYIHGYINSQEALGRVRYGDGSGAMDLIRRWWGNMLENGPGTGWFVANNDGSVDRGYFANTGWTTALPALSEALLGATPASPGYKRWQIAPQPSGLRWAQGVVPVPGGGLEVRWERTPSNGFVLTTAAPQRTEGRVLIPFDGSPQSVAMDGRTIWSPNRGCGQGVNAHLEGNALAIEGVSGQHTFAWGS